MYDLKAYLFLVYFSYVFFICIVSWFWYPPPSALVRSMIRMWYIFITICFISCLKQLYLPTWHRNFYLGGSWTGNSNRPYCRVFCKRKQWFESKIGKKWRSSSTMPRREDEIGVEACRHHRWTRVQACRRRTCPWDQDGCNALLFVPTERRVDEEGRWRQVPG